MQPAKKGLIFILVLALLAIFVSISIGFVQLSQKSVIISKNLFHKTKSKLLAFSGYCYVIKQINSDFTNAYNQEKIFLGDGTFIKNGDYFQTDVKDLNGKININDGITAASIELNDSNAFSFTEYFANALDPWPDEFEDSIYIDRVKDNRDEEVHYGQEFYNVCHSALLNFRVRRMLNSYGDVHRFFDFVYQGNLENINSSEFYGTDVNLPNPVYSIDDIHSTDIKNFSGKSFFDPKITPTLHYHDFIDVNDKIHFGADTSKNNGLGDHIIGARPKNGFKSLDEIEEIVNAWSDLHMLSNEYLNDESFFSKIKDDLTTISYEDTNFYRIKDSKILGQYFPSNESSTHPPGDFNPFQFDVHNLSEFSKKAIKHAVPLINLNQSSFFVRAAIFYSTVNVHYMMESGTTVPPYIDSQNNLNHLGNLVGLESMICESTFGQGEPIFRKNYQKIENGHPTSGRSTHLMSLRDAMFLSYFYGIYTDQKNYSNYGFENPNNVLNFDDFKEFLTWHRINNRLHDNQNVIEPYEKVLPMLDESGEPVYKLSGKLTDYNANGLFHISDYRMKGQFLQDYVEKTLPHIFSCIRRIPAILGAPAALQSPYMYLKPDINRSDYLYDYDNNRGHDEVKQPFIKIEDFSSKFLHPKICFLPCGYTQASITGVIESTDSNLKTHINSTLKLFETKYFRTQRDFIGYKEFNQAIYEGSPGITDTYETNSDSEFYFGPEFIIPNQFVPSQAQVNESDYFHSDYQFENYGMEDYIGFTEEKPAFSIGVVGLKDFDDDFLITEELGQKKILSKDPMMKLGINGKGYDPQIVLNFDPHHDVTLEPFEKEIGLNNSSTDLMISPTHQNVADDMWFDEVNNFIDKSATAFDDSQPRGGFRSFFGDSSLKYFTNISCFNGYRLLPCHNSEMSGEGSTNSLYWRPDEWMTYNQPMGQALSSGIVTLWFRMPSGYDHVTNIESINPISFTRVLFSLNLWEIYDDEPQGGLPVQRPASITIGLKKTLFKGLNIFARYDAGYMPPASQYSFADYPMLVPPTLSITESSYLTGQPNYDFLGFLASDIDEDLYSVYRTPAHRSVEATVSFSDSEENGPGTWHRLYAAWNLRWPNDGSLTSENQIFIKLLNDTSQSTEITTDYHQGVILNPSNYQGLVSVAKSFKGGLGFTHPFNSTCYMSLGEAHARRFKSHKIWYRKGSEDHLYPFWRFNSCIDNVRIRLGPSDPNDPKNLIPPEYLDPENEIFSNNYLNSNIYSAMRYEIVREGPKWHGEVETREPMWVINPNVPDQSKLLAIGTRVYYPPDSDNNTPYIRFSARYHQPTKVSKNEQNLIYRSGIHPRMEKHGDNRFRMELQYMAHKPKLNGDPDDIGDPLEYTGHADPDTGNVVGDHFTNIPWIKEISLRYIPPKGAKFIHWEEG